MTHSNLPNPATENYDVWVLAGQSNMQGCGWLQGTLAPDWRVWSFSSAGHWGMAEEPLHRLWESFTPVHQDFMRPGLLFEDHEMTDAQLADRENRIRTTGSGLGLSFGVAMADALSKPIGLIPAAHGGTSLDQWSPRLKPMGGRSLYGGMLERIKRAGGNLRGILWYQGESDATLIDLGLSYARRMDEWIAAVRADTGIADLPFIAAQIGRVVEPADRQGIWPGWNLVQEALRTLPERVPNTYVTSAIDLPLVDLIHVNTGALIRLGKRMAALALAGQQLGPRVASIERIKSPAGITNAIRVRFEGVTGNWSRVDNIRGFEARIADADQRALLFVVNAYVDGDGTDVIVLLNREMEPDTRLGYGLGNNPACDLADAADCPLCSFLPQPAQ